MPIYQYTVRDATGAVRTGTSESENADILQQRLEAQGFHVNDVKRCSARQRTGISPLRMYRSIRHDDLMVFWLEFSLLLDCNTPLLRALEIAAEQTVSSGLRAVLHRVMGDIASGAALFTALSRFPKVFGPAAVGMIRAGDVGGALPEAVRRLVRYLEAAAERRRESRQGLIITAILLAALVLLFLGVIRLGH